ncbi:MAG TPA: hypothetical protein VIH68_04100 [Bacteroidota bacterium]
MKTLIVRSMVFAASLAGCQNQVGFHDNLAPAPPQGISTVTGDHRVTLRWVSNSEPDLAGYNVFVSDQYAGRYTLIGTARSPLFVHYGAVNGRTYYYAVTAFDFDGNESDLSHDVAYDTPRPEGYGVVIGDYRMSPYQSGYDFSAFAVGPFTDDFADMFYEYFAGGAFMNVWRDTDIQDMGYTRSLDEITEAPLEGWSPLKYVQVIDGHTYVVWTWDDHYAKFRVRSISPTTVVFDWAYQVASGNPELKVSLPGETRNGTRRISLSAR